MKKHIPLLILTLFLISVSSGAVIQDSVKHTLISSSDTPYEGIITEGTKEKGRVLGESMVLFKGQGKKI